MRPQLTIRRLMIVVAGLAAMLACLATYHDKRGCGTANVPLVIHVVDDRTAQPIAGAKIDLILDYGQPPAISGITGSDGDMALACQAGATSYVGPFLRRYRTYHYSYALRIEAQGHQSEERMLGDFMKDPAYHTDETSPPPIVVRLKDSPPPS